VKVTDWTQVEPRLRLAEAQVDAPLPTVKSRFGAPMVRTSTVATVPAAEAVTVTFCGPEAEPTG
jgi:hypothetical protein